MFRRRARLCLGSAQTLSVAKEPLERAVELLEDAPDAELRKRFSRFYTANGQERLELRGPRSEWKVVASTARAGRGLSVDGLNLMDELRAMEDPEKGWSSLSKTTMAQYSPLTLAISNAGSANSIVLNSLQEKGREAANSSDYRGSLALFEWSAPERMAIDDPEAWRYANPALGHRIQRDAIQDALAVDNAAVFRTEVLCQKVASLQAVAVPDTAWSACHDPGLRREHLHEPVLGLDASASGHCTLVAASTGSERTAIALVRAWPSTDAMLADLGQLLDTIQPTAWAWTSSGPLAEVASDLRALGDAYGGMRLVTSRTVVEACMELAAKVIAGRIQHPGEPLLADHVTGARRLPAQDGGWRVTRRGDADGFYATALSAWLAAQDNRPRIQLFA